MKRRDVWKWLAWRLPHGLIKWCVGRVLAHATQGKYRAQAVPDLTVIEAMKRWDK